MKKGHLLLLFLFFLSSCELAKVGDPIVVPDVEDEFYIDWRENLTENQRSLNLTIRTIKEEQCPDASIAYDLIRFNLGYRISLNEITANNNCDNKDKPALVEIPLGRVSQGVYQLHIDLKNSVNNEGSLQANEDFYALNMRSEDGIKVLDDVLYKIPQNTVWGYINYKEAGNEASAKELLDELEAMSQENSFSPGYYGHFRIGSTGQVAMPGQPISSRLKTFVFVIPDKREEIIQLADRYRDQFGETIQLNLYDDKGWNY